MCVIIKSENPVSMTACLIATNASLCAVQAQGKIFVCAFISSLQHVLIDNNVYANIKFLKT